MLYFCLQPHGVFQARILEWVDSLCQGIFPTQGSNLYLLCLLQWQADFLPPKPPQKPHKYKYICTYTHMKCKHTLTYTLQCIQCTY